MKTADANMQDGLDSLSRHDWDDAIGLLAKAVELDPARAEWLNAKRAKALRSRGRQKIEDGNYEAAIADYTAGRRSGEKKMVENNMRRMNSATAYQGLTLLAIDMRRFAAKKNATTLRRPISDVARPTFLLSLSQRGRGLQSSPGASDGWTTGGGVLSSKGLTPPQRCVLSFFIDNNR
ncbi:MAG: hypothetical protein HUU20_15015 [Pirellulales bacterium]|nr:hypothetical protein [Pirellulales bacterium]